MKVLQFILMGPKSVCQLFFGPTERKSLGEQGKHPSRESVSNCHDEEYVAEVGPRKKSEGALLDFLVVGHNFVVELVDHVALGKFGKFHGAALPFFQSQLPLPSGALTWAVRLWS